MAATVKNRLTTNGGAIIVYTGTLGTGTETTVSELSIIDGVLVSPNMVSPGDLRLAATATGSSIVVTDATGANASMTYTMVVFGKY
jgi:hypothetical protein